MSAENLRPARALPTGTSATLGPLLARTSDAVGWDRWNTLAAQTGYCTHPVRVAGTTTTLNPDTGEILTRYDTAVEPDGALLLPCRNRRANVCPTCSATYAADTWHLTIAGLRGGKGIPATVTEHPRVFATLTAPSFGPVHAARSGGGRCQRRPSTCPHGATGCNTVHRSDDPIRGTPICGDCFDYDSAVLFNALAPKLWSRTAVELPRRLAAITGTSRRTTLQAIRVSYSKVAEYQRRGVIHLHVVIRLDARQPAGSRPAMPPTTFNDPAVLAAATRAAIAHAALTAPMGGGQISWGTQSDVSIITASTGSGQPAHTGHAVANYLAKYVTKTLPTSPAGTGSPELREHYRLMAAACRKLAQHPDLTDLRLAARAQTLGYPSRPTSRSRAYSTTMGALRAERSNHAAARHASPGTVAGVLGDTIRESEWIYAGRGWNNLGEAVYVTTKAAQRIQAISHAAEARALERDADASP